MRSLLNGVHRDLTIHLFHDGSLNGHPGVKTLSDMVEEEGAVLKVRAIDPELERNLPGPGMVHLGTLVWFRCLLSELLPDVDRVLYLDADTLVVSDVDPLLEFDLADAPLAAVPDVLMPSDRPRVSALGITDFRRYLNAGVLLLDLEQLRAENASDELLRVAFASGTKFEWGDQDALNVVFAGRWRVLHPRWNAQGTMFRAPETAAEVLGEDPAAEALSSPGILHFEGPNLCKPWHALNTHPWRQTWWATLARTPWASTPPEDRTAVTSALRLLPEGLRIWTYSRILGLRARRARSR